MSPPPRAHLTALSGKSSVAFWTGGLDVEAVNRTGQLGGINLAGPKSRDLLQPLTDIDLSPEVFPYLAAREGMVCGKPALLIRVGFVGELGYEIHMAPDPLRDMVDALMTAGEPFGLRPFGVEAQRRLRLEKGHIIVGQDTDGLTNPYEAAMPWACHMKKDYFIGKRSLQLLKEKRSRLLVGFELTDPIAAQVQECHLVIKDGEIAGRVTSIGYSPTLGRMIGLAYLEDGTADAEGRFQIRGDGGTMVTARIVPMPFHDPDGLRQMEEEPFNAGEAAA